MPANTIPIYPRTPNLGLRNPITPSISANVATDGSSTIGTNSVLIAQSGADGSYWRSVRVKPYATAAGTSTSATVIRIFETTQGSGATTSANTRLLAEQQIPSISAANTTAALPDFEIPLNVSTLSGVNLIATTSIVAAANTGFSITPFGGDY